MHQMKRLQANIWSLANSISEEVQERPEGPPSSWLCLFWTRYCLPGCGPCRAGILRVWAPEPSCLGVSSGSSLPCCVSLRKSVNLSLSPHIHVKQGR